MPKKIIQKIKEGSIVGDVTVLEFLGRTKINNMKINKYYKVKCNNCGRVFIIQEQRLLGKNKKICYCERFKIHNKLDEIMDEFLYNNLKINYSDVAKKIKTTKSYIYYSRQKGLNMSLFEKILNAYNMDYTIFIRPKTEEKKNDL